SRQRSARWDAGTGDGGARRTKEVISSGRRKNVYVHRNGTAIVDVDEVFAPCVGEQTRHHQCELVLIRRIVSVGWSGAKCTNQGVTICCRIRLVGRESAVRASVWITVGNRRQEVMRCGYVSVIERL